MEKKERIVLTGLLFMPPPPGLLPSFRPFVPFARPLQRYASETLIMLGRRIL